MNRSPAPDWIPRATDKHPSDAMPSAGHVDWREEAEWWRRTCNYWREQATELQHRNELLTLDLERERQEVTKLLSEHELAPPDIVRGNQLIKPDDLIRYRFYETEPWIYAKVVAVAPEGGIHVSSRQSPPRGDQTRNFLIGTEVEDLTKRGLLERQIG